MHVSTHVIRIGIAFTYLALHAEVLEYLFNLYSQDRGQDCVNDYLHIHENHNNGYGIGKYCRSDRNASSYTTTNIAYIRFHTDSSNQKPDLKGFKITFESEDFDECLYGAYCSHHCTNLPGSYECYCPKGFFLSSDRKQCFGKYFSAMFSHSCVSPRYMYMYVKTLV